MFSPTNDAVVILDSVHSSSEYSCNIAQLKLDVFAGAIVGSHVGSKFGNDVGAIVGSDIGSKFGNDVGAIIGSDIGSKLGNDVGAIIGSDVGSKFGNAVGL